MEWAWDIAVCGMFAAAFLDAFFATGLIFYGMMFFATAGALHATGKITTIELTIVTYLGSVIANYLNFYIGYFFGKAPFIRDFIAGERAQRARDCLEKRGLFIYMTIGRFVGFLRPVYAILIGTLHVDRRKFMLYELIIAIPWTLFWVSVLLFGESLILHR